MAAKAFTLAILALCAFGVVSLPQAGSAEEQSTSTLNQREECDLRLWVRADDLSPSTIVEGDVRLLNNMTKLSPDAVEGCRILNWSLHLRHRERAAIRIPLKDAPFPKKPAYNYTWDSMRHHRRYRVDAMLLAGADATSLFANKTDPYEEEKAAYYRALEEYVRTVQNADNWIVREDEATLFDVRQEAPPSTLEAREGLQISMFPFGVAVPDVHFPEAARNNMHWFSSSDEESAKIKSNEETDLSYYAEIHLANGSAVEVQGGKTKFFVPGGKSSPQRYWTNFTLEEDCFPYDNSCTFAKKQAGTQDVAEGGQEDSKLVLSGSFEAPATIRRGEKMHVQGSILWDEAMDDKYILGNIRFDIQHRRENAWAVEQIDKAASATNRTRADIEKPRCSGCSSSAYTLSCGQSSSLSSALHVEEELKKYKDELRRGPTKPTASFLDRSCQDSELPTEAVPFTNGTAFELDVVPPKHLSGLRSNLFVKDELEWVIVIDAKERRPAEELASQYSEKSPLADQESKLSGNIHEIFHNDTSHWTEHDNLRRKFDLLGKVAQDFGDEDGASEKQKTFVARFLLAEVINQEVPLRKRNSLLSQLLVSQQQEEGESDCQRTRRKALYYLEVGARAPTFVDISSDDKIQDAVSLVNPCSSSQSEIFPLVDRTIKTTSHNPKDNLTVTDNSAGTSSDGVFKYRKTKYDGSRRQMQDCKEGHGACGGGANDVGTVWANKVMLPRLKAVLRRETFQASFRVHS